MVMTKRAGTPDRAVTEVGPGDYVKVEGGGWLKILTNTAFRQSPTPRSWEITLVDIPTVLTMYDCLAYAKADDFDGAVRAQTGLAARLDAGRLVDDDLRRVVALALDLTYYRTVVDDGGLGTAAWIELRDAVAQLPEALP